MKKFLRLYTRMTNCCFIFSLQAGVVIIGVLGIVWTASSLIINLFRPYESSLTGFAALQYIVAYLVLILICGGHVWILLAGSTANPNLMFLGFLYNTIIMMLWLILSASSYFESPNLRAVICIEGRCPDVLWLFDAYWRDTGIKCSAGAGSASKFLATREIFSIAPVLGYIGHWPDYIEQPGVGAPCYDNIPDTAYYVAYNVAANVSCPRGDWMSWDSYIVGKRKQIIITEKLRIQEAEKMEQKGIGRRRRFSCPDGYSNCLLGDFNCTNSDFNCTNGDFNSTILYDDFNSTILYDDFKSMNQNSTADFNQLLQQGCELNQPRFIVVSLTLTLFFSCKYFLNCKLILEQDNLSSQYDIYYRFFYYFLSSNFYFFIRERR